MADTVLEQLRKLDEQRNALLGRAKDEAFAKAQAGIDALNELGFDYRLVEGGAPPPKKTITRQRDPNKPCPVCGERRRPAKNLEVILKRPLRGQKCL